jgi:hypothetical protein
MIAYLDSSVVLRIVFGEKKPLRITRDLQYTISSEILKIECFRTVDRMRHHLSLSDDVVAERYALLHQALQTIRFVKLDDSIIERASQPFPTVVKSLDAIHLSTAVIWKHHEGAPVTFLTHGEKQGKTARALGFEVLGCA